MPKTQTQVRLEIYLKQVFEIVLHWGGREMTDIHAKVPHHPFSFPHTGTSEHYQVKHKVPVTICERDLALSTTGQMAPQRSRRICVADSSTTQQHVKLVVSSGHCTPTRKQIFYV